MKNLKDEQIIAALLSAPTVKEAAAICGLSEVTVHKRLKDDGFNQKYADARQELLDQTTHYLQGVMTDAIKTMRDVMMDQSVAKQVRLNAADALLRHCYKMTETNDILTRIAELERIAKNQQQ